MISMIKKSSIVAQHVELNIHVTPTMADILVVLESYLPCGVEQPWHE